MVTKAREWMKSSRKKKRTNPENIANSVRRKQPGKTNANKAKENFKQHTGVGNGVVNMVISCGEIKC